MVKGKRKYYAMIKCMASVNVLGLVSQWHRGCAVADDRERVHDKRIGVYKSVSVIVDRGNQASVSMWECHRSKEGSREELIVQYGNCDAM